jgi:predicted dehydrogenase
MPPLTRRAFTRAATAAATIPFLPGRNPAARWFATRGPNPDGILRVAVAGIRSRGSSHISGFQSLPGVDVVALVDVDSKVLAQRKAELEKNKLAKNGWEGGEVQGYADLRDALAREDIDIVSLATPNHLHALQTIWSCQAGKDVYVEKPVCHNIFEGRQMVRAAEKYGCLVQTGTQSRSSSGIRDGIAFVQSGGLGEIHYAHGTCFKPRRSIGKISAPQTPPEHVDWDLYCGPAPLDPLLRKQLHYDWHWQFPTGNGDLGNQGIHQMDMCRWALGMDELASSVRSVGGRFGYDDDGDTPNSMITLLNYDPAPILFEVRGLPRDSEAQAKNWGGGMDRIRSGSVGVTVVCEKGFLVIPNYNEATAFDADGKELQKWKGSSNHFANLVEAIRKRDGSLLAAPILEGHLSSSLCHMANISYTLGKSQSPEQVREALAGEEILSSAFERLATHLDKNGIDLAQHPAVLGAALDFDPVRERFLNSDAANRLRTREYRAPFIVPEEV